VRPNFGDRQTRVAWIRATFLKFRGEMAHFWQEVQSGQWLTAPQALSRGAAAVHRHAPWSVVLPAIYAFTLRRAARDRAGCAAVAAARIA
jgi:hypothetical protein